MQEWVPALGPKNLQETLFRAGVREGLGRRLGENVEA